MTPWDWVFETDWIAFRIGTGLIVLTWLALRLCYMRWQTDD